MSFKVAKNIARKETAEEILERVQSIVSDAMKRINDRLNAMDGRLEAIEEVLKMAPEQRRK